MTGNIFQSFIVNAGKILIFRRDYGFWDKAERVKDLPASIKRTAGNTGTELLYPHRLCMDKMVAGLADYKDMPLAFLRSGIRMLSFRGKAVQLEEGKRCILAAQFARAFNSPLYQAFLMGGKSCTPRLIHLSVRFLTGALSGCKDKMFLLQHDRYADPGKLPCRYAAMSGSAESTISISEKSR